MQDLSFLRILDEVENIKEILFPYTQRAYIVGGALRDFLLYGKLVTKDIDIEVYDIKPDLFDEIMQKIGAKSVGKSFFVYKYKNYDLALARYENKVAKGHCGFMVKVCDDEKDGSKRRDFTINALMLNIYDKRLLDFWGGLFDLYSHKIRLINEDTFKEDSLRVLRGVQFASRFKFSIDKNTFDVCKNISLDDLSKDRINAELSKMFKSNHPEIGLWYIYKLNLFKLCFGVEIKDKKIFYKCLKNIQKSKKFFTDELYESIVLYHLRHSFNLDKKLFEKLGFKRSLILNAMQDKKTYDEKELLKIAMKIPLKDFLALDDKIVCIAQKYGVFDKKLKLEFNFDDILNDDDFVVKKEKIIDEKINNYIKENNV